MPNRPNIPQAQETFVLLRRPLSSQGDMFISRGLLRTFPVQVIRHLPRKPLPENIEGYVVLRRPLSSQGSPQHLFGSGTPFSARGSPQDLSKASNSTLTQETFTEEYQRIGSAQATPFFPGVSSTFFFQATPFFQEVPSSHYPRSHDPYRQTLTL